MARLLGERDQRPGLEALLRVLPADLTVVFRAACERVAWRDTDFVFPAALAGDRRQVVDLLPADAVHLVLLLPARALVDDFVP